MFCGYDFSFFPFGGDESASGQVIGSSEQSSWVFVFRRFRANVLRF
jgi:hypothetical protein